jgi:ubiquinone/menaquinone biosynthesis C-methylase UbiE
LPEASIDVVFTSNFLEHLRTKEECNKVLQEVLRVLRPGGRFVVMGPNIKYTYKVYWDFYDHSLALSHLSLSEALECSGFEMHRVIARFLPFTMVGKTPSHDLLIRAYLAFPPIWKIMGRQFLVVAGKPILD